MSPHVRILRPDEYRTAHTLFGQALHAAPADDERWARSSALYVDGRTFGVDGDPAAGGAPVLAGTAMSFPTRLTVPGGESVPMAAVTRVGVRADHTRRGILSALMRAQLEDVARRGEVVASLRASEARIYGRFGYGVATRGRDVEVRSHAALRAGAPRSGAVRMITAEEARADLPALYERIHAASAGPGAMTRAAGWWEQMLHRSASTTTVSGYAVHRGPDGDDGYAVWTVENKGDAFGANVLRVGDLQAANPAALTGLWRFLLGVDLAERVTAHLRPLAEPVDLLLEDPRACSVTGVGDETWLRLVDVAAALAARSWGESEPVRIRVHDRLLSANDTVHVVGEKGVVDPGGAAELECDVAGLALAYLGDRTPSELVAAGWWTAHDPAAVARADALFAVSTIPWCGTFF